MELELKFACRNRDLVRQKLQALGFKQGEQKHLIDTYYIVNCLQSDGYHVYLRIREDRLKKTFSVDHHTVVSQLATREVEVQTSRGMFDLMALLGFRIQCVVDKTREEYTRDDSCIVTLDEVSKLGSFIEVEIEGESNLENEEKLNRVTMELGLDLKDRVFNEGYPDLLLKTTDRQSNPL